MASVLSHPFKVGFSDSMSLVLLGGGVVMVLAFLILTRLPAVELRTSSAGVAARAEERGAAGPAPDTASASIASGTHVAEIPSEVGDQAPATPGRHALREAPEE